LGVESTIFGLKIMWEEEHFNSRRFRPVELIVMGNPLDAHRILKKFPISGVQNFLFIMRQIYKMTFQNFN